MKARPPAYIVTVTQPTITHQFIVFGKRAGLQQLRHQQRQHPTAQVTLAAEKRGNS